MTNALFGGRRPILQHLSARRAIAALPPLPSIIRYLDEYDDQWRSILQPATNNTWRVTGDTTTVSMHLKRFEPDLRFFIKHLLQWMFLNHPPRVVQSNYALIRGIHSKHGAGWFYEIIERSVFEWEQYWETKVRPNANIRTVTLIKKILHFLCEFRVCDFRPVHKELIRSFSICWPSKFSGVESGESILTALQEAKIIEYLDSMAERAKHCTADRKRAINQALFRPTAYGFTDHELLSACLLCISYQHGLRPIQIARINVQDLRLYEATDGKPIVHFLAYHTKKRTAAQKRPFVRAIKREWAHLFVEYRSRRLRGELCLCADEEPTHNKLFPITIQDVWTAIGDAVESITGSRRSVTDLRHSAAQRLADAGASLDEIAEFLGHSQSETSLVYFQATPTQASKINNALALSPIYTKVLHIAQNSHVQKSALGSLPSDHQIGGVPHGIPIAGIGACTLGQSLCSKSPVLSCYTCRKFIPVNDPDIHQEALNGLRSVVRFFFDECRGDDQSPAFVQLKTTLQSIVTVISNVEKDVTRNE